MLYTCPHLNGARDYLCDTTHVRIDACITQCVFPGPKQCDETIFDLIMVIMMEEGLRPPTSGEDAVILYQEIRRDILNEL